ncbi:MAG TPA: hypothetical protein VLA02_07975 [Reyranella sp.]|nr:hypothetical protein [Reyranella sp.]
MLVESDVDDAGDAQPGVELSELCDAPAKRQHGPGFKDGERRCALRIIFGDQVTELFGFRFGEVNGDKRRRADDDQSNVPRLL